MDSVTRTRWRGDEDILGELKEAVRCVGHVPEAILAAGRAAFACRMSEPGLLLARLRYDSLLEDALQFRAGPDSGPRIVTFGAGPLSLEIELTDDQIVGQLIPAAAGEVTMMPLVGGAVHVVADDMGCFLLPRPPSGPVRFRCQSQECALVTDWVQL